MKMKGWLEEPDQFDWMTSFLRQRGLERSTRSVMVVFAVSSALAPLAALIHRRVDTTASIAVGAGGAAFAVLLAWLWLTRWPTRRMSLCTVVLAALCTAAWSLTQPAPTLAALACTALTITGGYAAFFHGRRALSCNTVIAAITEAIVVIRVARDTGASTAAWTLWLTSLLTIGLPLGIRKSVEAMRRYAVRSDQDPLTGLLNRRGFSSFVSRQLIPDVRKDLTGTLVMLMVDVDDFKRVNDTQGHAAGDQILLDIAALLQDRMPADAAVCRAGGEEFLVAVATQAHNVTTVAPPLCAAIRTHCGDVTASIGMACADGRALRWTDPDVLVNGLIEAADAAMYEAKRSGGDRVHMAQPPLRT